MTIIDPGGATRHAPASRDERVRQTAQDLQGVFVGQLLKAMRETVPTDGLTSGGAGEDMFTSMLDEHTATEAPARWHHGIGEALYRQLSAAASGGHPNAAGPDGDDNER